MGQARPPELRRSRAAMRRLTVLLTPALRRRSRPASEVLRPSPAAHQPSRHRGTGVAFAAAWAAPGRRSSSANLLQDRLDLRPAPRVAARLGSDGGEGGLREAVRIFTQSTELLDQPRRGSLQQPPNPISGLTRRDVLRGGRSFGLGFISIIVVIISREGLIEMN